MAYQELPAFGEACSSYAYALRFGPALPPNGTPTPPRSLERLNERLEALAFGERDRSNAPPLETYTTTTTEHGDVVRATEEYVRWFRRTYSVDGPEDRLSKPAPRPAPKGAGGEGPVKARRQGHFFE